MLNVKCQKELADAREFADKLGLREQLEEMLERLGQMYCRTDDGVDLNRARCDLSKDFAPYSFGFDIFVKGVHRVSGGLIYHGPIDGFGSGSSPTFAVTVESHHGWSIHT